MFVRRQDPDHRGRDRSSGACGCLADASRGLASAGVLAEGAFAGDAVRPRTAVAGPNMVAGAGGGQRADARHRTSRPVR